MAQEDLRKKVDLAFLAAFYGGLLTEKQRRILSLHCEEDYSLGEIAAETGASRQAVHESLARAAEKLTEAEEKIGAASRFRRMEAGLQQALGAMDAKDYSRARKLIVSLLRLEQEDKDGL